MPIWNCTVMLRCKPIHVAICKGNPFRNAQPTGDSAPPGNPRLLLVSCVECHECHECVCVECRVSSVECVSSVCRVSSAECVCVCVCVCVECTHMSSDECTHMSSSLSLSLSLCVCVCVSSVCVCVSSVCVCVCDNVHMCSNVTV